MSQLQEKLLLRDRLTEELRRDRNNTALFLDRARCYQSLGYHDLAAGDAYMAVLLIDELLDDSGEHHDGAMEALQQSISKVQHADHADEEATMVKTAIHSMASKAFNLLVTSLNNCGCLSEAYELCLRGLNLNPLDDGLEAYQSRILAECSSLRPTVLDSSPSSSTIIKSLRKLGSARRELYPWNKYELDRYSSDSLEHLNTLLRTVAPKCEVRTTSLPLLSASGDAFSAATVKQLGLFAVADLAPGETVLEEYSLLTVNNRLQAALCDACSAELISITDAKTCLHCSDIIFCSTTCLEKAAAYHPAICQTDLETWAKDPKPKDAADSLYLLLLGRTFALAESQKIHPLELAETRYLWGDYTTTTDTLLTDSSRPPPRTLPFSFSQNIQAPLHLLEALGLDIFSLTDRYDFWIINTLFAKFRAVASARQGPNGIPEVSAVHPLWCLANHSCTPNVQWKWGGMMHLRARTEEEMVQWGGGKQRTAGISRGEEILNHYCDTDLNVQERNEWLMGPLGGICRCGRCVAERAALE